MDQPMLLSMLYSFEVTCLSPQKDNFIDFYRLLFDMQLNDWKNIRVIEIIKTWQASSCRC